MRSFGIIFDCKYDNRGKVALNQEYKADCEMWTPNSLWMDSIIAGIDIFAFRSWIARSFIGRGMAGIFTLVT
jgi:hypothetical protein